MDREPLTTARRRLGAIVEQARHHQPTTLTDRGHDAAVVVSAEEYRRLRRLDEEDIKRRMLARARQHQSGQAASGESFDEAMDDLGLPGLADAYRALHGRG